MLIIISILLNLDSNKGKNIIRLTSKQHWNCRRNCRQRLPTVGSSFLALFHAWNWSGRVESQFVRRPLQNFVPYLFSLHVTVKLKSEIISKGHRALIVNMTILETWDETCASYLRRAWLWLPKCVNIRCRVYASDNFHILTIKFKFVWFCSIHSINL